MPKSKPPRKPRKKGNPAKQEKGIKTPPRPPYHQLADPAWVEAGATTLLVDCRRILDVPKWPFKNPAGLHIPRARALFVNSKLTYFDTSKGVYPAHTADAIESDPKLFWWPDLPKTPYVLLLAAYDENAKFQSRDGALAEIGVLAGLLNALGGRNLGERQVFELEVDLESGNYIGTSGPLVLSYGNPVDLTRSYLDFLSDGIGKLETLADPVKNRARLSLRWFGRALQEQGHDEFVSLWVAVETIAMPNETNVKLAVAALGRIYGITEQAAKARFQLGRLQGLRSDILHEGLMPLIDTDLNRYLEALYRDLFFDYVALDPKRWVDEMISRTNFNVTSYLQKIQT